MQKIVTYLWFNDKAEEAANFYTSIFKNSKIRNIMRVGPDQQVINLIFEIEGREFIALNGGSAFTFSPAISLFVKCNDQEEVDEYWNKLIEGGKPSQCGWLEDKYGLSWQIVPNILGELLQDKDPIKSKRVMDAMLKMVKIDINVLQEAYNH